ncbi:MAG: hypothetical protein AAFX02_09785, partial [Pseudomonadota bacterium]
MRAATRLSKPIRMRQSMQRVHKAKPSKLVSLLSMGGTTLLILTVVLAATYWLIAPLTYEFREADSRSTSALVFSLICGAGFIGYIIFTRVRAGRQPEAAYWAGKVHTDVARLEKTLLSITQKNQKQKLERILSDIRPVHHFSRTRLGRLRNTWGAGIVLTALIALVFIGFFASLIYLLIEFGLAEIDGSVLLWILDAMAKGALLDFFESFNIGLFEVGSSGWVIGAIEFAIRTSTSFAVLGSLFAIHKQAERTAIANKYLGESERLFAIIEAEYRNILSSPLIVISKDAQLIIEQTIIPYYRAIYVDQKPDRPRTALMAMEET